MKDLSEPCSYRFFNHQKAHIQKKAREQGHESEVVYLRSLVEADIKREAKRQAKRRDN